MNPSLDDLDDSVPLLVSIAVRLNSWGKLLTLFVLPVVALWTVCGARIPGLERTWGKLFSLWLVAFAIWMTGRLVLVIRGSAILDRATRELIGDTTLFIAARWSRHACRVATLVTCPVACALFLAAPVGVNPPWLWLLAFWILSFLAAQVSAMIADQQGGKLLNQNIEGAERET